jgi:hypothetical protein
MRRLKPYFAILLLLALPLYGHAIALSGLHAHGPAHAAAMTGHACCCDPADMPATPCHQDCQDCHCVHGGVALLSLPSLLSPEAGFTAAAPPAGPRLALRARRQWRPPRTA